ncbi:MAG TPA: HAD-IA family hydrolase [Burkholderiaceae bacterium]|nr:HAD-IA family hydrolase [Burkholderiaceae bacterium]
MLRALIWDVDGTLAETEDHGHRIAFNRAFEEAGLPWRWGSALYAELLAVTGGKERIRAWWWRVDPVAAAAPESSDVIARLHERKTAHYLDLLDRGSIGLRPGVQRLLMEAANHGLKQAIATTTTLANVHRLLDVTLGEGATTLFDVIGAADAVTSKKPAPDIYRWVLERLDLPASQCLAIEDSFDGVAAARAAEVPVVLVRSHVTPMRPCVGCIDDMRSLRVTTLADLMRTHELSQVAA